MVEATALAKCVHGGLSTDSSEGSAPHYEVFVALRGLRNLSEENRDKVSKMGTGCDGTSPSRYMPPGATGTVQGWGGGGGEENLPGGSGKGEMRSTGTCVCMERLPRICWHHPHATEPHSSLTQAVLFPAGPLPSGSLSPLQVPAVPGQRGPCQGSPGGAGGLQGTPGRPRSLPLVPLSS